MRAAVIFVLVALAAAGESAGKQEPGSTAEAGAQAAPNVTAASATPNGLIPEKDVLLRRLYGIAAYSGLAFITACIFKMSYSWPEPVPGMQGKDLTEFTTGPCDCSDDYSGFCLAFWCLGVRWAENCAAVGLFRFWPSLVSLMVVCAVWRLFPAVGTVMFIVAGVWWRQKLREKFDMPKDQDCANFLADIFLYCCCVPCVVAQEARFLEEAARANHPAVAEHRALVQEV